MHLKCRGMSSRIPYYIADDDLDFPFGNLISFLFGTASGARTKRESLCLKASTEFSSSDALVVCNILLFWL